MKNFALACRLITPVFFSYVFVGLAYGILVHKAGYSALWAALTSALIYAGSMQIVMISLLSSGASLWAFALTALFINARHIFYGIGYIDRFRGIGGWKYPYMVLTMTDETYSVLCSAKLPEGRDGDRVIFSVQFACHMLWIAASAAGAIAGELLPVDLSGIEFSATAFFAAVAVNQWRQADSHIPAVIGLISAAAFYFILGPDSFILPALSASTLALVLLKDKAALRNGGTVNV